MMMKNNCPTYRLTATAYERLIVHCRSSLPNEACGLLIANSSDTPPVIDTIQPIANIHPKPLNSFSFDPADWISGLYEIERNGQQLVGYYHSHPRSLPIPSSADSIGTLPQTGAITLIVSFLSSEPDMRAYWKCSDEWQSVTVELLMDSARPK